MKTENFKKLLLHLIEHNYLDFQSDYEVATNYSQITVFLNETLEKTKVFYLQKLATDLGFLLSCKENYTILIFTQ